jgi:hypothetical protein
MRVIVHNYQDNHTLPEAFGAYTIRSLDKKKLFVRSYTDRNLFSVAASDIERPMVIVFTQELLGEKLLLQLSASPKFTHPQIVIGILHGVREPVSETNVVPMQFSMQLLNGDGGKPINFNMPSEKVEMSGDFVETFVSNFNVSVSESASLTATVLPITCYAMLEDIQTFYDPQALMIKNLDRNKYRGWLLTDGTETKPMVFKIYCLGSTFANLTIDFKFVGGITYRKLVTINCSHSNDLAKDLSLNFPSTLNSPRVRLVPLTVSEAVGIIEIQSFEPGRVASPISYVKLIAPESKQGMYLDHNRPAYLEFGCLPGSSKQGHHGVVTGHLKAMGRVFKIETAVTCDEQPDQTTSLLLTLGSLLYVFVAIPLALLAAFHFYGRVKALKSQRLQETKVHTRRVVEMSQMDNSINVN